MKLSLPKITLNFMRFRKPAAGLSLLLFVLTVLLILTKGLNFGIDFTGGALIQLRVAETSVGTVRDDLTAAGFDGFSIQEFGGGLNSSGDEFLLRLPVLDGASVTAASAQIKVKMPQAEIRRTEFVGPQIGAELRRDGLIALLVALAVIMVYISFRFEMRYGLGAIVALVHDIFLTVGVFAFLQKEISLTVLAALLTIIGYSLNDTIVVFDRIRENRLKARKTPLVDILNMSLNQTLSRTIMTSITTLLVLAALFYFGGEVIHDFAFTLLFGVLVGTYSSIFVASPVLLSMESYYQRLADEEENLNENEPKKPKGTT